MADPLGMMASIVAVAGLGVKVAKILDSIFQQWDDSEEIIQGLRTRIQTFCASLSMLSTWMAEEYSESPSSNRDFVKNLALAGEGCMRLLLKLNLELDIVCEGSDKLQWREKLQLMWNQSRINELEGHLNSQTLGLLLLLQWYVKDPPLAYMLQLQNTFLNICVLTHYQVVNSLSGKARLSDLRKIERRWRWYKKMSRNCIKQQEAP